MANERTLDPSEGILKKIYYFITKSTELWIAAREKLDFSKQMVTRSMTLPMLQQQEDDFNTQFTYGELRPRAMHEILQVMKNVSQIVHSNGFNLQNVESYNMNE